MAVELIAPKDTYYDESKSDSGNLYNNTGEGIVFGYLSSDNEARPLVTMKKNADGSYDMEEETGETGHLFLRYSDEKEVYSLGYSQDESAEFYVSALDGSRPGDDYLLNFRLKDYPGVVTAKEDDDINFLAVYDKKMLWRANLYIAEEKGDWNDLHPWIGTKEEPNRWNYYQDGTSEFSSITGLQKASQENIDNNHWGIVPGGQVINIVPFTPVRTVGGTTSNPGSGNKIEGRVAYDYPQSESGHIEDLTKAMDSPFDYNKKILEQKVLLNIANSSGWYNTCAPDNKWNNYIHESNEDQNPFFPSRGFYLHSKDGSTASSFESPITLSGNELNAGTDCLGFAQRAAGYDDSHYQWDKLTPGYAEGGGLDGGNREFSNLITSKTDLIVDRGGISKKAAYFLTNFISDDLYTTEWLGPKESDFRKWQAKSLTIRPGDILQYNIEHIGIVAGIDVQAMKDAKNIVQLMKAVSTVEATYGSLIQFVFKRNMMEGLSGITIVYNNPGSWHYGWKDKLGNIPLRSWSIERLKVK